MAPLTFNPAASSFSPAVKPSTTPKINPTIAQRDPETRQAELERLNIIIHDLGREFSQLKAEFEQVKYKPLDKRCLPAIKKSQESTGAFLFDFPAMIEGKAAPEALKAENRRERRGHARIKNFFQSIHSTYCDGKDLFKKGEYGKVQAKLTIGEGLVEALRGFLMFLSTAVTCYQDAAGGVSPEMAEEPVDQAVGKSEDGQCDGVDKDDEVVLILEKPELTDVEKHETKEKGENDATSLDGTEEEDAGVNFSLYRAEARDLEERSRRWTSYDVLHPLEASLRRLSL